MRKLLTAMKNYFTGQTYIDRVDTPIEKTALRLGNCGATLADIVGAGFAAFGAPDTGLLIAVGSESARNAMNYILDPVYDNEEKMAVSGNIEKYMRQIKRQ